MLNLRVCALALVTLMSTSTNLFAGIPAIDSGNHTRTYGYVVLNHDFGPSSGDGFLYVHIPSLGNEVRLDYLHSDKSGAHELTPGLWIAIDGYLDSEAGCLDGPNTMVRPLIVYRWVQGTNGSWLWQIYDHDSMTWRAW